jgi:hypothetical protein
MALQQKRFKLIRQENSHENNAAHAGSNDFWQWLFPYTIGAWA